MCDTAHLLSHFFPADVNSDVEVQCLGSSSPKTLVRCRVSKYDMRLSVRHLTREEKGKSGEDLQAVTEI